MLTSKDVINAINSDSRRERAPKAFASERTRLRLRFGVASRSDACDLNSRNPR
jgi:hypothetical protein